MALTPQNNEAFLREVDEEVRRDQLIGFWQRWGKLVIVGVVVALAALGGFFYWQHRQNETAGVEGEKLNVALDHLAKNRSPQAKGALAELAQSDSEGFRGIAKFTQADVLLQANDLKGAAARFAEVANDSAMPQPFRDLALVRQTSAEFDTLQPQQVIDRLRGLAVKESPWFGSAGEMVAIAHLRMNRRDLAARLYGDIAKTESVPESIRQRAVQMAGSLSVGTTDTAPATTPQTEGKKAG